MALIRVRRRSRGPAINDSFPPSPHDPRRSGFSRDGAFLKLLETALLACVVVHRECPVAAEAAPTGAGVLCGSSALAALACVAIHRECAIAAEAAPTGAGALCGSAALAARRILPAMHTRNPYAC